MIIIYGQFNQLKMWYYDYNYKIQVPIIIMI